MESFKMLNVTELICPICSDKSLVDQGDISPENGGTIYVAEDMEVSTEYYSSVNQLACSNGHTFFIDMEK
jgi:hypothetical protein